MKTLLLVLGAPLVVAPSVNSLISVKDTNTIKKVEKTEAINTYGIFDDIGNWLDKAAKDTKKWVEGAAKDTADWVEGAAKDVKDWVGGAVSDVSGTIGSQLQKIKDAQTKVPDISYPGKGINRSVYASLATSDFYFNEKLSRAIASATNDRNGKNFLRGILTLYKLPTSSIISELDKLISFLVNDDIFLQSFLNLRDQITQKNHGFGVIVTIFSDPFGFASNVSLSVRSQENSK